MKPLNGTKAYLCGPVEAHNSPNTWRNQLKPHLIERGIIPLDPLEKPKWVPQIDVAKQIAMKERLSQNCSIDELHNIIHDNNAIREYCLGLVRTADFLIVKLDRVFTVGTFEEITYAKDKPVFIISDQDIPSMWLVDQLYLYTEAQRKVYIHKDVTSLLSAFDKFDVYKLDDFNENCKWISLTFKP